MVETNFITDTPRHEKSAMSGNFGLFGKAISSATGRGLGVKARIGFNQPSTSSRLSGARPAASMHAAPGGQIKREPIATGLYDDLPPPADWNEDSVPRQPDSKVTPLERYEG